jgi:DNA-binding MarR family transcriptional regulator
LAAGRQPSHEQYRTLAELRYLLRRFTAFSESAAREHGLTPAQHQALLSIKGFTRDDGPTVGELAERLCIRHNSAVELVDRLVKADLVVRRHAEGDRRQVQLKLTPSAENRLAGLSAIHAEELYRLRPALLEILDRIGPDGQPPPAGRRARTPRIK